MNRFAAFFAQNLTLKVSAFGIALLLWVSVRVEAPNRAELPGVPVRVDLADPNWALLGDPNPASVVVRFGGPSGELLRLSADRPSLVIPMDQVLSGDTTLVLRNQWVRIQDRPGVIVESIQPSTIRLTFEPIQRAGIPPAIRFTGDLPDGLALAALPLAEPGEIRVTGPRSRIAEMDSILLRPLDLSLVTASGPVPVAVDTTDTAGLLLQPVLVQLQVEVEERVEEMVSGIPVVLPDGIAIEGLLITPSSLAALLIGARSLVEGVDPSTIRAVVEVEESQLPGPGEEETFRVILEGLPPLLRGELPRGEVTISRVGERSEP